MVWINPKLRLPPQGKKVNWFRKGDSHMAIRIGKYWFPIPHTDSRLAHLDPPDFWQDIEFPHPYTGKMFVGVEGVIFDLDGLEKSHNEIYKSFLNELLKQFRSDKWRRVKEMKEEELYGSHH